MEVCAHCHETDRRVINCTAPLIHHIKWYRGFVGKCDICGKTVKNTYTCIAYLRYRRKNGLIKE